MSPNSSVTGPSGPLVALHTALHSQHSLEAILPILLLLTAVTNRFCLLSVFGFFQARERASCTDMATLLGTVFRGQKDK